MEKKVSKKYINGPVDIDTANYLAQQILDDIRAFDLEDLSYLGDPIDVLIGSMLRTERLYILYGEDGKLLACGGKCFYSGGIGRNVWFVGTNEINKGYVRPLLMKIVPEQMYEFAREHGIVYSIDRVGSEKSVRWISRLGAKWLPEGFIFGKEKFRMFYILDKGGE